MDRLVIVGGVEVGADEYLLNSDLIEPFLELCLVDTSLVIVLVTWVLGASLIGKVEACENRSMPVPL